MTPTRRLQVQGVAAGLTSLAVIIALALLVPPGAVRSVLLTLAVLTYLGGKAATFGFSPTSFAECWRSSLFFRVNMIVAGPCFAALMVAAGFSSTETSPRRVVIAMMAGTVLLLTDLFRQREQQGGPASSATLRQPVG